jgi:hypothetical protein
MNNNFFSQKQMTQNDDDDGDDDDDAVIYSFLLPKAQSMTYWGDKRVNHHSVSRMTMSLIDQLLFVLMRLKVSSMFLVLHVEVCQSPFTAHWCILAVLAWYKISLVLGAAFDARNLSQTSRPT